MSYRLTVRMAAPSIVISLVLLAVGSLGGWYVSRSQRETARTLALDMSTIQAAEQLVFAIAETRLQMAQFQSTGEPTHWQAIDAASGEIEKWLAKAEALADDDQEKALTAQVRAGYRQFLDRLKQSAPGLPADARRQAVAQLDELATAALLAPAKDLLALEERLIDKSGAANQAMSGRVAAMLVLLGVSGAVAGLVAGFGIARGISRSLVSLYVPIRAASGRLEEVIGPVDIAPATEIEHLDVILRSMADRVGTVVDRLQQSEHDVLRGEQMAALGQLAAGLAHELRNPLTTMKLLVQAAGAAEPDAGLRGRDLAVVTAEMARLERSIQTFLDFARPPRLEKTCKDLRAALESTLDLVAARASRQNVRLERQLAAEPLVIEADHEQLRQVFLNLALNALDAMPQSGKLCVTAGRAAAADFLAARANSIAVTFADSGPGISAELGNRIFEPYVSTKDTGLGLGLAICRQIVDAHGGQIAAANDTAGGAVFTVRLPAALESRL